MANYQQGNYMYVIPSYYDPMSFSDMDKLFQVISQGNKQAADDYIALADNVDAYSYLDDVLPEDSKARKIYDNYAGDLKRLSEEFLENGVGPTNMQGYLNLRRRYNGEIGRLAKADEAFRKELETRRNIMAKDPTMLYTKDNISIDDFLGNEAPNLYSISGQDLYKMGAEVGATESARIFSDPKLLELSDQYNIIRQTNGLSPEYLQKLRNNFDSNKTFSEAVDNILYRTGVTTNFTDKNSYNYKAARQSVIDGIINGSTYKQADSIQQNPDYMSPQQQYLYKKQMNAVNKAGSKDSSGSGGSSRVPAYEEGYRYYISRGGTRQSKAYKKGEDGYSDALKNAGKVNVVADFDPVDSTTTYKLTGTKKHSSNQDGQETVYVTFKRHKDGSFTEPEVKKDINTADFGVDFAQSGQFWIKNYDKDWDDPNLTALAKQIQDIITKEGSSNAYQNYDFYFEPDNASNENDSGGFWIEPRNRAYKTIANDKASAYDIYDIQSIGNMPE